MRTRDVAPDDETALRALLTTAVHTGPEDLPRHPPALWAIGSRARRLHRLHRARQAGVAGAAVLVVASAGLLLASGSPAGVPAITPAARTQESDGSTAPGTIIWVVPSDSMAPTIRLGDSVVIDPSVRTARQVRRGDVVVVRAPTGWLPSASPSAAPSSSWILKRVIGLPGDTVTCCGADGRIAVNGVPLTEPYVAPGDRPSDARFGVTVGPGRFWLMGDARARSLDSRFHRDLDDGQVPQDALVGRVVRVVPKAGTTRETP